MANGLLIALTGDFEESLEATPFSDPEDEVLGLEVSSQIKVLETMERHESGEGPVHSDEFLGDCEDLLEATLLSDHGGQDGGLVSTQGENVLDLEGSESGYEIEQEIFVSV